MQNEYERGPICNTVAEAAVVGALLNGNAQIDSIADILNPKDFYSSLLSRLFAAVVERNSRGETVNAVSLLPMFKSDPAMRDHDGGIHAYLAEISTSTASAASVFGARAFAKQIVELAKRRRLVEGLEEAIGAISDTSDGVTYVEALSRVEAACMDEGADLGDGVVQVSVGDAFREMMEAAANDSGRGVIAPAIGSLNAQMGQIKPHQLVVMAGRPGMGKTAVALSYAISAADAGHGVLFITLEMSRNELMQRAAASMTFDGNNGIPYEAIRDNTVSETGQRRVWDACRAFKDMPLHIVDAGSLTIGRLNMIVRRYKRKMAAQGQTLDLVVVDYLQLLRADRKTNGRYEEVTEVSMGLKGIAKTHDVGVMALAQLSREVEKREDKRPILSDLRDSGQIEQDADAICFLYRHEYYLRLAGPGKDEAAHLIALDDCQGKIDFIIAKRRNGTTGTAIGQFHGGYMAVRG